MLSLSIFAATLAVGIIAPFLPLYAGDLGATGIWIGAIFAGFSLARTISIPIGGRLSDRKGRKLLLSIGVGAATVISVAYIFSDNLVALAVTRFIHGLAGGLILPVAQAYVGDIVPEGQEGKWMGYFNAVFFTGIGAGPLIGGFLADHYGVDNAFLAMAFLNLVAFIGIVTMLPNISTRQKETGRPASSYRKIMANREMRGIFGFRLSFALARGVMTTFLPILAGIQLGLSASLIGVLLMVNVLGMSALQVPSGMLADRVNKKAMIITGSMFYLAGMALMPSAQGFWHLFGLSLLLGIGGALSLPSASVLVVGQGRRLGMGTVMAAFSLALTIGMFIGPLLGGLIADVSSLDDAFYFAAIMVLLGTAVFTWLVRSTPAAVPDAEPAYQE